VFYCLVRSLVVVLLCLDRSLVVVLLCPNMFGCGRVVMLYYVVMTCLALVLSRTVLGCLVMYSVVVCCYPRLLMALLRLYCYICHALPLICCSCVVVSCMTSSCLTLSLLLCQVKLYHMLFKLVLFAINHDTLEFHDANLVFFP
jgi:hypothetical protein